jgi:hypothetical protein
VGLLIPPTRVCPLAHTNTVLAHSRPRPIRARPVVHPCRTSESGHMNLRRVSVCGFTVVCVEKRKLHVNFCNSRPLEISVREGRSPLNPRLQDFASEMTSRAYLSLIEDPFTFEKTIKIASSNLENSHAFLELCQTQSSTSRQTRPSAPQGLVHPKTGVHYRWFDSCCRGLNPMQFEILGDLKHGLSGKTRRFIPLSQA